MITPATTPVPHPATLAQSERAMTRMDRRLVRAEWFHRCLLSATAACAIAVSASTLAGLAGLANGVMSYPHKNTDHPWPTASLPSWTIAKTGLAGCLAGFGLLIGAAGASNAQVRRIGRLTEERFDMYVKHETLRKSFNAQTTPPPQPQLVPADLRLQKPVTLTIRDLTFTRKPRA